MCVCVCVLRCPWYCQLSRQATRALRPASRQPAPSRGSSLIWTPPSCSPPPAHSMPRTMNPSPTTGKSCSPARLSLHTCTRCMETVLSLQVKDVTGVSDPPSGYFPCETERMTYKLLKMGGRKPLELETTIHPEGL